MILPLFCFGSLMDRDVLACVLGENPAARIVTEPGVFAGYRKVRLPHETYPILVPDADSSAEGILIDGLNKHELNRIVFFEGDEYELSPCSIHLPDGSGVDALFFDEGVMPPPRSEEWDLALWLQHHKGFMLRQSSHYMSYYGLLSASEADSHWQSYQE
ncbi:MAG: gamma-glutamylcyclotransferase family protein [bacterium]